MAPIVASPDEGALLGLALAGPRESVLATTASCVRLLGVAQGAALELIRLWTAVGGGSITVPACLAGERSVVFAQQAALVVVDIDCESGLLLAPPSPPAKGVIRTDLRREPLALASGVKQQVVVAFNDGVELFDLTASSFVARVECECPLLRAISFGGTRTAQGNPSEALITLNEKSQLQLLRLQDGALAASPLSGSQEQSFGPLVAQMSEGAMLISTVLSSHKNKSHVSTFRLSYSGEQLLDVGRTGTLEQLFSASLGCVVGFGAGLVHVYDVRFDVSLYSKAYSKAPVGAIISSPSCLVLALANGTFEAVTLNIDPAPTLARALKLTAVPNCVDVPLRQGEGGNWSPAAVLELEGKLQAAKSVKALAKLVTQAGEECPSLYLMRRALELACEKGWIEIASQLASTTLVPSLVGLNNVVPTLLNASRGDVAQALLERASEASPEQRVAVLRYALMQFREDAQGDENVQALALIKAALVRAPRAQQLQTLSALTPLETASLLAVESHVAAMAPTLEAQQEALGLCSVLVDAQARLLLNVQSESGVRAAQVLRKVVAKQIEACNLALGVAPRISEVLDGGKKVRVAPAEYAVERFAL